MRRRFFLAGLVALVGSQVFGSDGQEASAVKAETRLIEQRRAEYQIEVGGKLDDFNTARYVNLDGHHMMERAGFQPNIELTVENVGRRDVCRRQETAMPPRRERPSRIGLGF